MSVKCYSCGDFVSNIHVCDDVEAKTKHAMSLYSKETLIDKFYKCMVEKQDLEQENELYKNFLAIVDFHEDVGEYLAEFPHSTKIAYGKDIYSCFLDFKKIYGKEQKG